MKGAILRQGDDNKKRDIMTKRKRSSSSKRSRKRAAEEEEERRLTKSIFGSSSHVAETQQEKEKTHVQQNLRSNSTSDTFLFEIDRKGVDLSTDGDDRLLVPPTPHQPSAAEVSVGEENKMGSDDSGPAWVDEEDSKLEVSLLQTDRLRKLRTSRAEPGASALNGVELEKRMRQRYQNTTARTANTDWADISPEVDVDADRKKDDEQNVHQGSSMSLLRDTGRRRLEPSNLDIVRCPDANLKDPNQAVVRVVQFHPGSDPESPLILTGGFDKTLRFFQVGDEGSKKIHGIHCKLSFVEHL